jgi:hypothetical protein
MRTHKVIRAHNIEAVKGWINTLSAVDQYNRDLLQRYNGDELDRMTGGQIEMILAYCKAVYHMAYKAGADCMREKKESV